MNTVDEVARRQLKEISDGVKSAHHAVGSLGGRLTSVEGEVSRIYAALAKLSNDVSQIAAKLT